MSRRCDGTVSFALTAIGNTLAFWNREQLGMEITPGVDEVSLALVTYAWSRTYRSRAVTLAADAALETRNGIRILPDQVATDWPAEQRILAETGSRQRRWTTPCTGSLNATECAQPISSLCSSNIRGRTHRDEHAARADASPPALHPAARTGMIRLELQPWRQ